MAKAAGIKDGSFETFDKALSAGKVPLVGKVTDRLVRSAYAALERSSTQMSVDRIPSPLSPPHDLSWYFSVCTCPSAVRQFATMLGRGNIRVWSVARDLDGWLILAQVFGADNDADAVNTVELSTRLPITRLHTHVLSRIEPYKVDTDKIESFMSDYAKNAYKKQGVGTFVQLFLERRM